MGQGKWMDRQPYRIPVGTLMQRITNSFLPCLWQWCGHVPPTGQLRWGGWEDKKDEQKTLDLGHWGTAFIRTNMKFLLPGRIWVRGGNFYCSKNKEIFLHTWDYRLKHCKHSTWHSACHIMSTQSSNTNRRGNSIAVSGGNREVGCWRRWWY